jgi:hypothetical protein
LSRELKEMPIGIAKERLTVRRPDDACGRDIIGRERLVRPPGGPAVTEQLDVRRFVSRAHWQDIDLDTIDAVELYLRRPLVERALTLRQPMFHIEVPARREAGNRDRAVVDPHHAPALP